MYSIFLSNSFKKDAKKLKQSDLELTMKILDRLALGEQLEARYKDHALKGELQGYRDCHIKPDLVLIYKIVDKILLLQAIRITNHSNIFK